MAIDKAYGVITPALVSPSAPEEQFMWRCGSPECNCEGNKERCATGDQESAKNLYLTLKPMVQEAVRYTLPYAQPEDVEDVVQETFIKMFVKITIWNGECDFCLWVRKIATNAALDHLEKKLRREERESSLPDHADSLADRSPPLSPMVWNGIEMTYEALPEEKRIAYEIHVIQGKTVKQTARELHKSERMIYNWLSEIRLRFLGCLD